jgi:TRAP-type mannitol/chloroaromatic compound transport system permease small subunit
MLTKTREILDSIQGIVNILIPIAFALAILFFFWGIAKYIWSSGTAKEDSKKIMIWGVIAIFVMTSIWGIVNFIGGSLGLDKNASAPKIPTIGP